MYWRDKYIAYFGDISANKAKAWEQVIDEKINHVSANELESAIERMAQQVKNETEQQFGKPTVHMLVSTIFYMRGQGRKAEQEREHERDMIIMRDEIKRHALACNVLEAWDVICKPDDVKDCEELERYAATIGINIQSMREEAKNRFSNMIAELTNKMHIAA